MLNTTRTAELRFEILEDIGQEGKNADVYLAQDLQLDAQIVVKKVAKANFDSVDGYFTEASTLYLSNHSNVVPVHYACEDDDFIYIAMPHFARGSLKAHLAASPITVRQIIVWATQILSGLHNVHSKRLIHFDIKPDNILFSDRGEALISDFGLAKHTAYNGFTEQDRVYGPNTPPEVFQGLEYNNQFDIYQVGLTLYRMCVGDQRFYAELESYKVGGAIDRDRFIFAVRTGRFPSRNQFPEHIPQKLAAVVKKCLAIDLDERYSSVIDIVNDLSDIEGNQLDWIFSYADGYRKWYKEKPNGAAIQLVIDDSGQSLAENISEQGGKRKIRNYCKEGISRSEAQRFLREN